jgi:hypothetical protein
MKYLYINLISNSISIFFSIGVGTLSQNIRFHPSIATIWLGANQIGDLGARHISHLLKLNHNIKELNVSNKWPKPATWTGSKYI